MNVTSSSHSNTVTPYVPASRIASTNTSAQHPSPTFPPVEQAVALSGVQGALRRTDLIYSFTPKRDSSLPSVRESEGQVTEQSAGAGEVDVRPLIDGAEASQDDRQSGQESRSDGYGLAEGDSSASDSREGAATQKESKAEESGRDDADGSVSAKVVSQANNDSELELIAQLAARDQEVRTHEQAHAAAGGQYAGAPSYQYERGPDGVAYAVSGEVPIDVAPINGDPDATIRKMEQVQSAALAPAEPSGQDRAVAAIASRQLLQAQAEKLQQDTDLKGVSQGTEGSDDLPSKSASEEGTTERSGGFHQTLSYRQSLGVGTYHSLSSLGVDWSTQDNAMALLDVMA